MSAHRPVLPARAIELVDAAGLQDAQVLLADFAAAGLIKTYALVRETSSADAPVETVRDAQIPSEAWQRIVAENKIPDALNGGTVRLQGSGLRGGLPSVQITGVSFSEVSLAKVLDRYCESPNLAPSSQPKAPLKPAPVRTKGRASPADNAVIKKEVPPIKPGALTASIAQTIRVTGLGRTKVNELMDEKTLVRRKVGRRTLITVESIERLVGARVS